MSFLLPPEGFPDIELECAGPGELRWGRFHLLNSIQSTVSFNHLLAAGVNLREVRLSRRSASISQKNNT